MSDSIQSSVPLWCYIPRGLANQLLNVGSTGHFSLWKDQIFVPVEIGIQPQLTFSLSANMLTSSALPFVDFLNTLFIVIASYTILLLSKETIYPVKFEGNNTHSFSVLPVPKTTRYKEECNNP